MLFQKRKTSRTLISTIKEGISQNFTGAIKRNDSSVGCVKNDPFSFSLPNNNWNVSFVLTNIHKNNKKLLAQLLAP